MILYMYIYLHTYTNYAYTYASFTVEPYWAHVMHLYIHIMYNIIISKCTWGVLAG